jgi:hypothetical protein
LTEGTGWVENNTGKRYKENRDKEKDINKEESAQRSPADDENKAAILILSENIINLSKAMIKKEIYESLQRIEPEQKLKQRNNP